MQDPTKANGRYGRAVARIRREQGISQQRLADMLGMDRAYLSRIENGKVNFPGEELRARIAAALNVNDASILHRAGIAVEEEPSAVVVPPTVDQLREELHDYVDQLHPYKLSEAVRQVYLIHRSRLEDFHPPRGTPPGSPRE